MGPGGYWLPQWTKTTQDFSFSPDSLGQRVTKAVGVCGGTRLWGGTRIAVLTFLSVLMYYMPQPYGTLGLFV